MKISFALAALATARKSEVADDVCVRNGEEVPCFSVRGKMETGASKDIDEREDRRYVDLAEMNYKHWQKNGAKGEWDERKFWGYGCHCFMVGDRPMTEMGHGIPVDNLDSSCRQWKECQMCVRQNHGDECIGEFVKYTWKYNAKKGFQILNDQGTCARELGECDKKFVLDTFNNKGVYDEKNNYFYGGFDRHDRDQSCPPANGAVVVHECCGGFDKHWTWMGTNKNQCCKDPNNNKRQTVTPIDDQCPY